MSSVLLVAQNAAEDIRDIRGPIHVPAALPWLLGAAIALAAALLVLGLLKLVRSRKRRPLTPYQQAKLRLTGAAERAAEAPSDQLAEQLSGALREYVELRFGLRAAHRTSEDFLAELWLREDTKLASYRPELERFLASCDLAKFAGRALSQERRVALCADALRFVEAAEASQSETAALPSLHGASA